MNKLDYIFSERGYLNTIILFSLLSVFFIGVEGANKLVYSFQAALILLFTKFKISPKKLFISVLTIIFLIFFSKNLNSIKIALIFSLIIFSFDFEEFKSTKNSQLNFLFFSLIIFMIGILMKPNTNNYKEQFELNYLKKLNSIYLSLKTDQKNIKGRYYLFPEKNLITDGNNIFFNLNEKKIKIPVQNYFDKKRKNLFVFKLDENIEFEEEILIKNINNIFLHEAIRFAKYKAPIEDIYKYKNDYIGNDKYPKTRHQLKKKYFSENSFILLRVENPITLSRSITDKNPIICELKNFNSDKKLNFNSCDSKIITNVRFKINSIDSNYTALVLMLISLLFSLQIKKKNLQFITFTCLWLIISYYTKSRTTLVFGACFYIYFYFNNFTGPRIILGTYIISNIIVIFLGYLALNAVADPNNIWHPESAGKSLLPVTNDPYNHFITRYFQFFDSSSYIRFTRNFQSYLVITNDFYKVLFPDNVLTISDLEYVTKRNLTHNFDVTQYHPHNFFLYSVKECGLIVALVYHFYIFSIILKYQKFRIAVFPLLFASIFLGMHFVLIIHLVCLFSFKRQNNILMIFNKLNKKINAS